MTPRLALLALYLLPAFAMAQSLRVQVQLPTGPALATNGGALAVQSDGREAILTVAATNGGAANIALNQFSLSGSDFSLINPPNVPATLRPGETSFFGVRYTPSTRAATGQVTISYTEGTASNSFTFTLVGSAPDFTYFFVAPDGTRTSIAAGGRLSFGLSRVNAPLTGNLVLFNSGNAPGTISQATVAGRDFSAVITLPATVQPGQELAIPLTFTPQARGLSTGALTVVAGSRTVSFPLDGTGAQPEYVVAYALRADGNVRPLVNDGKLTFAPVAATATDIADVVIANQGNGNGTVRSVSVAGTAFQLVNLPLVPSTIAAGQAFRFGVQFAPRQLGNYTGTLRIELDDRVINATIEGSTSQPEFSLLYIDPASRNILPLINGSTLPFGGTSVGSTSNFTVILRNSGSGTGFIDAITVSGDGFQVADLPSLPATIAPAQDLRFTVRFTPRQRDAYRGSLQVQYTNGFIDVAITGLGTAAAFAYDAADPDSEPVVVTPGAQELPFSAAVGQTSTKTIRLTNNGNAEAVISAISVTGAGFQILNAPFLPVTVPVNGTQTFTVAFSPTAPGRVAGRLQVGGDTINIVGTGLAARLEFSYSNEAGTTQVAENGVVVFSPARVGEASTLEVAVQNTGTTALAISNIDVASQNATFTADNLPPLPFSLEPGGTFRLPVRFSPDNIGTLNGSLRINNSQFTLSGVGRQPSALPEYRVEGPSGVQQPLQQPAVGLSLARGYPLALRGTLTLSFLSDVFSDNPAVQLASGGRTIGFRIPANATRAVFDNGLTEIRLQTGTVAGSIQLQPTLLTTSGLDLTPSTPPLTMTIERARPQLLRAEIVQTTANSITLAVTGYTTTRTLRQAVLQLTPQPDEKLTVSTLTVNVESTALSWFQTAQSQGFGGLFSLTIPVVLSRDGSTENLAARIQSISVTVSNELGASNAVSVP